MKSKKRRRHDPEFKARVALEAIKNINSIQEIAQRFEVHPGQVSDWKKKMLEGAPGVFGPGQADQTEEEHEKEREKLHSKIGQLSVEVDFLRKKSRQLGL